MTAAARSGHTSHGLARIVSHAANARPPSASTLDEGLLDRPANINVSGIRAMAKVAARPNVPVRSDWSAISPTSRAAPSIGQVASARSLMLAQAGMETRSVGVAVDRHAVPSHLHLPSGDSWPVKAPPMKL